MNAIFKSLEDKEKRALERLVAAVLLAAALFVFLAMRERSGYFEAGDTLGVLQAESKRIEKSQADAKAEWLRWREAEKDLESFRGSYFYDEKSVYKSVRLDLQRIFNQAGMDVPLIRYQYSDLERLPIKKIVVTFNYAVTYADLRQFLAIVERFPKFLAVEKIDFQKIDAESGLLNLKMTMAAYYEI